MIVSFPAIFTSIVTVTLLIIVLSLLLLINRYGLKIRYEYISFMCIVIIGRLIIPFEWNWTHTISLEIIMPTIYNFFHQKIYNNIELLHLFTTIWFIGSIYLSIKYLINMKKLYNNIELLHLFTTIWFIGSIYLSIKYLINMKKLYNLDKNFENKLEDYQKKFEFLKNTKIKGIYKLNFIEEPFITNPFKPTIYLPNIIYSKQELKFILLHESQHIKNKDLYTKILVQILIIIYWWFPLIYILRNIIEYILELRVDHQVTQLLEEKEKHYYLLSLVTVTKKLNKTTPLRYKTLQSQFTLRKESLLKKRIDFFYNETNRNKYKLLIIVPAIFLILSLPSIVFEPYQLGTEVQNKIDNNQYQTDKTMKKRMYILLKKNGDYYLVNKETQEQSLIKNINQSPFNQLKIIKEK